MTDLLIDRVRRRLVERGLTADAGLLELALREEADGVVDDMVFDGLRREVAAEIVGAGPLEPLLATPGVTDVVVNSPAAVWFDRGRGMERADVRFADEAAVRRLAQRLAATSGRRLDDATPCVDAVLADGTRLHAVVPPISEHTTLSLRVLARNRLTLEDLVAAGSVAAPVAEVLRGLVDAKLTFVLTGGTGTGKTTLLGALIARAAPGERLVLIEDAAELVVDHPHVVRLVTRAANVEGAGAVGLRELVRQSLRMRPDRLVVGEFRGAEMVELLVALNTGHEGGATLHANSAADVPARFAALGALAGLPEVSVAHLVASAIDVIVHLRRAEDGRRVVSEIAMLHREDERLGVTSVWSAAGGIGPAARALAARLGARGTTVPEMLLGSAGVGP
ncbi:MAG TPA: TadA family conjugal transfer-associated ATPase [Jatrophihabitans sp.]|jgi:pilus assembly protein CpaF